MDKDSIRSAVLEAIEASLSAQLRVIRSLRAGKLGAGVRSGSRSPDGSKKGMSHIEMAHAILLEAQSPLHVNDIIERIAAHFHVRVDRESLVSALSKKIMRQDRFMRTDRNTFALIAHNTDQPPGAHE